MTQIPLPVIIGAVGLTVFAAFPREAQAPTPETLTPVVSTPTLAATAGEHPGSNIDAFEAIASDPAKLQSIIGNTSLRVPDQAVRVSLRSGTASFTEGPTRGNVSVASVLTSRKTTDGSYDAFADIVSDTDGSGTFHYIVLFRLTAQTIEDTSYVFVGDRVKLVSATPSVDGATGY